MKKFCVCLSLVFAVVGQGFAYQETVLELKAPISNDLVLPLTLSFPILGDLSENTRAVTASFKDFSAQTKGRLSVDRSKMTVNIDFSGNKLLIAEVQLQPEVSLVNAYVVTIDALTKEILDIRTMSLTQRTIREVKASAPAPAQSEPPRYKTQSEECGF